MKQDIDNTPICHGCKWYLREYDKHGVMQLTRCSCPNLPKDVWKICRPDMERRVQYMAGLQAARTMQPIPIPDYNPIPFVAVSMATASGSCKWREEGEPRKLKAS